MVTISKAAHGAVSTARAKLLKAQSARQELKLRQERGELVDARAVERTWQKMVVTCRAKLLALPTKLAPQVVSCSSMAEVHKLLEDAIHEALTELADDGGAEQDDSDVKKTRPTKKKGGKT